MIQQPHNILSVHVIVGAVGSGWATVSLFEFLLCCSHHDQKQMWKGDDLFGFQVQIKLIIKSQVGTQFRNCSCSMACSACFPVQPWGWDHPLDWALTHQSLIKKMPHRHGHSPGGGGNFKLNFKSDGAHFPISWDSLFPNMSQFA